MKKQCWILLGFLVFSCKKEESPVKMPKVQLKKDTKINMEDIKNSPKVPMLKDIQFILDEQEEKSLSLIEMRENETFKFHKTKEEQEDFWKKMEQVAKSLGFEPYWLYKVMIAESGINSVIQNRDTQATGLIQFMPSTARMLGTTINELRAMSPTQQLNYVYKFYLPYKNQIRCPIDLYIVTFYPYARGKANTYIIGSEVGPSTAHLIAKQNPNFDMDKNGLIQLGEYRKYVRFKVFREIPDAVFQTYDFRDRKVTTSTMSPIDTIQSKPKYKRYKKDGFNITSREEN